MKRLLLLGCTLLFCAALGAWAAEPAAPAAASAPAAAKKARTRNKAEAGSTAEKTGQDLRITPDPRLPNVLLLGDSISIGYHQAVRTQLAGKANVFRPVRSNGTAENCSDSGFGLANLDRWLAAQPKWDVIHFNWGLHDIKRMKPAGPDGKAATSSDPNDPRLREVDPYVENLARIVARLKQTGARLVFATTTPVVPGTTNPLRSPEDPARYNAAAVKLMQAQGVAVDDLFAFVTPKLAEWQRPLNVHFTDAGSAALGAEVARVIAAELAQGRR